MAERIRELRRRQGWTQEELADAAGLSLAVVKKVEQGGDVRMATLRRIARVLGVVAVALAAPAAPEPVKANIDEPALAGIRSAIHPPIGITGDPLHGAAEEAEPDLARLRRALGKAVVAYHKNRYDDLAEMMPMLVRSAHQHVEAYDGGARHHDAVRLRAGITGLAGRYLIQVRAHDLALIALRCSLTDAAAVGDVPIAVAAVTSQAWAMLRQGRLAEVELLCGRTADQIEPKAPAATPRRLAGWGGLLARAAVVASRSAAGGTA